MRLGIDVGGTNTDAVLMDGRAVVASAKHPTTADVSGGIVAVSSQVLSDAGIPAAAVTAVMIGTTHFTNAFVERQRLLEVGVIRLASPSGEALPPMIGWPSDLKRMIGDHVFKLPGGYEFDGREISPFDAVKVRDAAREIRRRGLGAVAISSVFAPINRGMEMQAEAIVREECPAVTITVSSDIGRIGFLERENATIMNAALSDLARHVVGSFRAALGAMGIVAPFYISQNDGTLMSADTVERLPILTLGSGPTNSMRGAAFLTGIKNAIVMDIGGTTADIGVLLNGFPRESSVAVDIGGVRTNFRMPDILALGLGGGTRIHLDPGLYGADSLLPDQFHVGPDSVGFRLLEDACLFGGKTLTASDIAVAAGFAQFGDPDLLPRLSPAVIESLIGAFSLILEDGIDRMKTAAGDVPVVLVGGGSILVRDGLKGASELLRPNHGAVANAIGAAIAQVGSESDHIFSYEKIDRLQALDVMRNEVKSKVIAAGGIPETVDIVEIEEVAINYLPGKTVQVRAKAVGELSFT